jgi:hypothetical protein
MMFDDAILSTTMAFAMDKLRFNFGMSYANEAIECTVFIARVIHTNLSQTYSNLF